MKKIFLSIFLFASLLSFSQTTYKGLPVIHAKTNKADYRVNNIWSKSNWNIVPEVAPDVLSIPTFSKNVQFVFYTDVDSIAFTMYAGKVQQFYVLTSDNKYALTEVQGFNYNEVLFDNNAKPKGYTFWYEENKNNEYLNQLRNQYNLETVIKDVRSDSAKALRILKWAHDQWKHNGNNQPKKPDALSILEEVKKEGKQFRCVEYGIVTTAALNALGMPARILSLKTKDVETTGSGAGHVLLEVFLKDMNKWVLMDGQWDAIPFLNDMPLNAVEFQQAIAKNYDDLQIRSLSGTSKDNYIQWVYPYLYYFDVAFDNREGIGLKKETQGGKQNLMLVPEGAKEPTIFQKKWPISNVVYTRSVAEFYAPPSK